MAAPRCREETLLLDDPVEQRPRAHNFTLTPGHPRTAPKREDIQPLQQSRARGFGTQPSERPNNVHRRDPGCRGSRYIACSQRERRDAAL